MHPKEAKRRRQTALHNAELAGQSCAKEGGSLSDNPYAGKKLRGAIVELYRAWERGYNEQQKEQQ